MVAFEEKKRSCTDCPVFKVGPDSPDWLKDIAKDQCSLCQERPERLPRIKSGAIKKN